MDCYLSNKTNKKRCMSDRWKEIDNATYCKKELLLSYFFSLPRSRLLVHVSSFTSSHPPLPTRVHFTMTSISHGVLPTIKEEDDDRWTKEKEQQEDEKEDDEFFSSEEEEEEEEEDDDKNQAMYEDENERGCKPGHTLHTGKRWSWFHVFFSPFGLLLAGVSLALLLLGAGLVVSEWQRYHQAYLECAATFEVHADFSDKPICVDPHRDRYEMHDLLDCTKAERYVAAEPVRLCALRSWAETSHLARFFVNASTKFDSATAPWILVAVCSLAVLMGIRAWISERGKTERAALQYEYMGEVQQSQGRMLFEALPPLLEQQKYKHQYQQQYQHQDKQPPQYYDAKTIY